MRSLGRSFNGLWFATGAANLGDGVVVFVLPLLALASGASDGQVALVTTLATIAWPLFGIHGGWIVDRSRFRSVLFWVNLVRGLALVGLGVSAAFGVVSFWLVAVAALVYGISEVLVDTALVSTVPGTVLPGQSGAANARIEATINATNQFIGPPLAGALFAIGQAVSVATGGLMYLIALVGVAFVKRVSLAETIEEPDHRIRAGMSYLFRDVTQRWLTIISAGMNLVWGMWGAVVVLYVVAPGPLKATAFQYGLVFAAMAVGGLVASVLYGRLRRWFGVSLLLGIDTLGTVALVLAPALAGGYGVVLVSAAIAGAGSSTWRILIAVIRQNLTPGYLLGRVYSASRVISWGALPLGSALAGLLVELFGLGVVFWTGTGIATAVVLGFILLAVLHPLAGSDGEHDTRQKHD